ncbi:MAG: hypothetical protein IPN96_18570 [Anaerolineales bacterium]|nr:hypothetical protein [Anaerolineales bacterium]
MSRQALTGLIESLENTVKKLTWKPAGTEWGDYYENTNYPDSAFEHKKQLVHEWALKNSPRWFGIWAVTLVSLVVKPHLGARSLLSFDIDPAAVEISKLSHCKNKERSKCFASVLDLTNQSRAGLG